MNLDKQEIIHSVSALKSLKEFTQKNFLRRLSLEDGREKYDSVKGLLRFIREFIENEGLMVFLSFFVAKTLMFINTIIVVRLIPEGEYGLITLIASAFLFFLPLSGMGSSQGLLRYAVLEKEVKGKETLSRYLFWKGLCYQLIISLFYFGICMIYIFKYEDVIPVIVFFTFRLIGFYFYNHIEADLRARGDNKKFAIYSIAINVLGLILAIILTISFGSLGYLIALAITPWFSLFYLKAYQWKGKAKTPAIDLKAFWKYAIHSASNNLLAKIIFTVDFFMIGMMMSEDAVAAYKIAIVIPMNLMFIPMIFIQTDYPKLVKNQKNKQYLIFYLKNYYKIFIPLGLLMLFFGYLFKDNLVPFIFGEKYGGNATVFFVLICAVVSNMWMKNIYGNLIAAIGKAVWNTYVGLFSALLLIVLLYFLIPIYGILGASIGVTISFIAIGLLNMLLFHFYLKNIS